MTNEELNQKIAAMTAQLDQLEAQAEAIRQQQERVEAIIRPLRTEKTMRGWDRGFAAMRETCKLSEGGTP